MLLQDNWTSFLKARLNCSLPGQFPFYYDQLQSTFLLRKQRLVYALFTTPPSVYTLDHLGVYSRSIVVSMSVCLSVCLSVCPVRSHNSKTTRPNFTKVFMRVAYYPGSVLFWRRCDILYTSGFADDVMYFSRHWASGPESSTTLCLKGVRQVAVPVGR